ncbi:MAG TPA: SWIM zinc finger family protein, partial [Acidimicrobiia bacterium]
MERTPRISVTALTDDVLASHYGGASIARGRKYAAERRVRILRTHEDGAIGLVVGTAQAPYRIDLEWHTTSGRAVIIYDSCSCPLGGSCKHVVAVILTLRGAHAPVVDWRHALAGLQAEHYESAGASMAIEFAVTTSPPTNYIPNPPTHVTLRPLRKSAKGTWVRTGATWRDVASQYGFPPNSLDADHLASVRALLSARERDRYDIPSTITLDGCGPNIWALLRQAVQAGVELVAERATADRVELAADTARAEVELTTTSDGAIRVTTGVRVGNDRRELVRGSVGLVGSPAHALFALDGGTLTLTAFERPLHPSIARLAGAPPLEVPASDIDELL